ncbi:hypothetical protein Peur_016921 [Populus x canadensis]
MALHSTLSSPSPTLQPPPLFSSTHSLKSRALLLNLNSFTNSATRSLRLLSTRRLSPVTAAVSAAETTRSTGTDSWEKKPLFEVKDLTAVIAESKQEIPKGVNVLVYEGEVHAIMGKNGSGGSVVFKGENLLDMEPKERSLAGLFMSFQSPVEIPGANNIDFLNVAYNARRRKRGLPELGPIWFYAYLFPKLELVNMKSDFLNRNLNGAVVKES